MNEYSLLDDTFSKLNSSLTPKNMLQSKYIFRRIYGKEKHRDKKRN